MPDPMMEGGMMPQQGPQQGAPSPDMMGGMPPQQPQQQMAPPEPPKEDEQMENLLDFALTETNLAKHLKNKMHKDTNTELLTWIGDRVVSGFNKDWDSVGPWMKQNKEWMKLALMVRQGKTFPWPHASNVKYPLLATAAMQYSARAYPSLVPADGLVVKARVVPDDTDGELTKKASRIARHMSHQVMNIMPDWEQDMDKLLITHAITGICFKKTYHNSVLGCHHSHIVYPENLIINYWAKSLEKAYRKTELLYYTDNDVQEKIRNNEEFLDVDLSKPTESTHDFGEKQKHLSGASVPPIDESAPHVFLAQHTFLDLDDDGYEEPYIVTVHRDSKQVVRIIARWEMDGVHYEETDGEEAPKNPKIIRIEPLEYFTAFPFIPNPDGSVYGLGFGLLLGSLNESVNSIINQLIDSGTINNLQSGFIGKGLRIKMGNNPLQPGEWRVVNATGDDLRKSVFPLPSKEPSGVLFNLLNMLISSGNQLASIAEIFVGKNPGQNTPATTTQETVKQGMAVFTAVYKRVYRSLAKEFKKLYRLNTIVPGIVEEESRAIGGEPLSASDYNDENIIIPGGDPTGDSETMKQAKIDAVGQMLGIGTIDPMAFTQWALQTKEIPNWQQLLAKPQPPAPDPAAETEKLKQQTEQIKQQGMQTKFQQEGEARSQLLESEKALAAIKDMEAQSKYRHEESKRSMELMTKKMEGMMDGMFQAQKNRMDLIHTSAQNQARLNFTKSKAAQGAKGKK